MPLKLPHPLALILIGVLLAAGLTWILPAGQYQRRDDPATGRRVVVAGTYDRVTPAPVGVFRAVVAVPRGLVDAAEVIGVILLVGGAWGIVDRAGTLGRATTTMVRRLGRRRWLAVVLVSLVFALFGALENMQEEIIPLVPVLLLLGRGLGLDPVAVVAMSLGAAGIGSAFGPLNPFQAGLALKLAQLPLLSGAGLRLGLLAAALAPWIWWTIRRGLRPTEGPAGPAELAPDAAGLDWRHSLILLVILLPLVAYIVGVLRFDWGFNELSAAFLVAGLAAGLLAGLGLSGTIEAYAEGFRTVVGAAVMVGAARAISLVLEDGRVIDTILQGLATPLEHAPRALAAGLMIPFHALIHVPVPSVSGQAVLTLPILVPLSDLLGIGRQATVLAYQTGAGLVDILSPTNGAMLAILLAARVSWGAWVRFALPMVGVAALLGLAAVLVAM